MRSVAAPLCRPSELIVGPAGSGKTTELARTVANAVRLSPNPYGVLVLAPTDARALELRERVQTHAGSRRTDRYAFLTPETLAQRLADLVPRQRLASPGLRRQLAEASFAAVGLTPECRSALLCVDDALYAARDSDHPVAGLVRSALARLQFAHPADVLHPDRLLTLEHVFVDDLDAMPPGALAWLSAQARRETTVTATAPCDFRPPWPATARKLLRRAGVPPPPARFHFDMLDAELDAAVECARRPAATVFVFANARVEARFLVRAALAGTAVRSTDGESLWCSREALFLTAALRALLLRDEESARQLLGLLDVDHESLRHALRRPGGPPLELMDLLETGEWPDAEATVIDALRTVQAALTEWSDPDFPADVITRIGDWLADTGHFWRPEHFSIIASEVSRTGCSLEHLLEVLGGIGPSHRHDVIVGQARALPRSLAAALWASVTSTAPEADRHAYMDAVLAVRSLSTTVASSPLVSCLPPTDEYTDGR